MILIMLSFFITVVAIWLTHEFTYVLGESMQLKSAFAVWFANIFLFLIYPMGLVIECYFIAFIMFVYFITTVFDIRRY